MTSWFRRADPESHDSGTGVQSFHGYVANLHRDPAHQWLRSLVSERFRDDASA